MKKPVLLACLAAALFTGCATNPYAQNYRDVTGGWSPAQRQTLFPPSPEPDIRITANFSQDGRHLEEKGYVAIGTVEFQGPLVDDSKIKAQARAVGADVVLYSSRIAGTERQITTQLNYEPVTPGVTRLSPGVDPHAAIHKETFTTSTKIFRQGAIFYRRAKLSGWGARLIAIPDSMRNRLQRSGAFVLVVREDSMAYKANLRYGDIIVKIGNRDVTSVEQCLSLLNIYPLKRIPVTVLRNEKPLDLELDMTRDFPDAG